MPHEEQPGTPDGGDRAVTDDEKPTDDATSTRDDAAPDGQSGDAQPSGGRLFSVPGMVSTVLGLVSAAAVVVGLITWSMHRSDADERAHRSQVMQTAASWTSVLINLNAGNVEDGMQRLYDKTTGGFSGEFDAVLRPYREVVQRIQSRSKGQVESVAIESVDYEPDTVTGGQAAQPPESAGRTDSVMVIATSIAENVGGKPQTVHWALQLDVSDVDGQLLISRMSSIR
jgi:hypothetical protein